MCLWCAGTHRLNITKQPQILLHPEGHVLAASGSSVVGLGVCGCRCSWVPDRTFTRGLGLCGPWFSCSVSGRGSPLLPISCFRVMAESKQEMGTAPAAGWFCLPTTPAPAREGCHPLSR